MRIVRLRSNLVHSFITSQAIRCRCSGSKIKGQGERSRAQRKVMYQQQKRYNSVMDRFSDFKLGNWHGVVIKAGEGWRDSGGLKLPRFLVYY